jgi:hypothetical protein
MGTWGPAIFSDDLAADVRDDFQSHIGDGHTPEVATELLLRDYRVTLQDPDDGPLFWLALAAAQWRLGRLLPVVRDRALQVIDSGANLTRWSDAPSSLKKREKVLETLREQLTSPQPPAKKVKRNVRETTDWKVGAFVSYRLLSDRICVFRVVEIHSDKGGDYPVVEVLDWHESSPPTIRQMRKLRLRPRVSEWYGKELMLLGPGFPARRAAVIGHARIWRHKQHGATYTLWQQLDATLAEFYALG